MIRLLAGLGFALAVGFVLAMLVATNSFAMAKATITCGPGWVDIQEVGGTKVVSCERPVGKTKARKKIAKPA